MVLDMCLPFTFEALYVQLAPTFLLFRYKNSISPFLSLRGCNPTPFVSVCEYIFLSSSLSFLFPLHIQLHFLIFPSFPFFSLSCRKHILGNISKCLRRAHQKTGRSTEMGIGDGFLKFNDIICSVVNIQDNRHYYF